MSNILTCYESVYACNFVICINTYRLYYSDTKALGNTIEHKDYNAGNKVILSKAGTAQKSKYFYSEIH